MLKKGEQKTTFLLLGAHNIIPTRHPYNTHSMPRPCDDKTTTTKQPLRTTKRLWKWILLVVCVVLLSVIRFSQVTTTMSTTRDVSTKQPKQSTIRHSKPSSDNTTNKKKQPYNGTVEKKKKKRHKSKEDSQRHYPANETKSVETTKKSILTDSLSMLKNETKVLSKNED